MGGLLGGGGVNSTRQEGRLVGVSIGASRGVASRWESGGNKRVGDECLSGVSSDGWVGLPVGSPRGVVWRWESGKVGSESAAALVDHRNRGVLYLRRAERGGSESAVSSRSMSLRSCLPACAYTLGESMRGADQPQFVCRSSNPRTPRRSPPACNTAGDCTEAGSLQLLAPASRQHAPQAEDLWGPVNTWRQLHQADCRQLHNTPPSTPHPFL